MKLKYIKYLASTILVCSLGFSFTSCADDLSQSSIDPQSESAFSQDKVFTKLYGLIALTGQKGPAGDADIVAPDEGRNAFYRRIFEANEFSTDECVWTWQDNAGIPELTNLSWNSSHVQTEMLYNRLAYNITQCCFFLDQTDGAKDSKTIRQRAEARFLRAMHYYYFLDLFGKAPFKEHFNNEKPVEKKGSELFDYIKTELTDIIPDLAEPKTADFGHADQAAAWLLLARLNLNAEIYTGTAQWTEARDYAKKVIDSKYSLCTNTVGGFTPYAQLFMADNDQNEEAKKEIIFPIRYDGLRIRSYNGSYYIIAACHGADSNPDDDKVIPAYGSKANWTCIRAREGLVKKFINNLSNVPLTEDPNDIIATAIDDRAMFYAGSAEGERTAETKKLTTFTSGLAITKWTNLRTDGQAASDNEYTDTDIPFLRVAEAYLTRAEANYRLGANPTIILDDINMLRDRAHATRITDTNIDDMTILDEWCREFYMEGRRRTDLIRFDCFTTNKLLWDWKGGTYEGTAVNSKYNLYPIPVSDLNNNTNMSQNQGY